MNSVMDAGQASEFTALTDEVNGVIGFIRPPGGMTQDGAGMQTEDRHLLKSYA